jgi:hypothetical protein
LHAGEDFRTTILRCYREMSRVVQQERGMARDAAMTAREFERLLIGKGLPPEAISTLTRLFEQVRYGHLMAGAQDTRLAVSCLTRIVDACQVGGSGHE